MRNHRRIRQSPSAHERQRRDFYDSFLEQSGDALVINEIKKSIIEWPQVRIDLLLEIAGKKAELLASFDGRPREHDAVDLLLHQGLHRHSDSEIRLAGYRRANAEHGVTVLNPFNLFS